MNCQANNFLQLNYQDSIPVLTYNQQEKQLKVEAKLYSLQGIKGKAWYSSYRQFSHVRNLQYFASFKLRFDDHRRSNVLGLIFDLDQYKVRTQYKVANRKLTAQIEHHWHFKGFNFVTILSLASQHKFFIQNISNSFDYSGCLISYDFNNVSV